MRWWEYGKFMDSDGIRCCEYGNLTSESSTRVKDKQERSSMDVLTSTVTMGNNITMEVFSKPPLLKTDLK